jgi:hypothetical protein
MAEESARVPGLAPAVGRLANALVAVLGPELRLGSRAYCACRALIREMQVPVLAPGLFLNLTEMLFETGILVAACCK